MTSEDISLVLNRLTARPTAPPNADKTVEKQAETAYSALTAYAKSVYNNEILKYRNGSLSGKFRLDIAPGSIIRIETAGELNSVNLPEDNFQYPMYASVDQVLYSVDGINGQASTSFVISSVRSEAENNDEDLTTDSHPLYTNVWPGAPLHVGTF